MSAALAMATGAECVRCGACGRCEWHGWGRCDVLRHVGVGMGVGAAVGADAVMSMGGRGDVLWRAGVGVGQEWVGRGDVLWCVGGGVRQELGRARRCAVGVRQAWVRGRI